ncbi:MAG TPA: STAS domain-containing protein [Rugosimonospora sp.]|nr:STAS domain-containing protein [Rugosimonospora sp.]
MDSGVAGLLIRSGQPRPRVVRIEVVGEIDQASLEQLSEALTHAAGLRPARVALDLTRVEFMSCGAMRYLLDARQWVPGLRIVAATAPVRRLIAVYGADALLDEPVPAHNGGDSANL